MKTCIPHPFRIFKFCYNVYTFVIIKNIIIYCIMYGWLNMVYGLSYFFNWTELNQFITLISFFSLLTYTNLIGSDKDKTLREGITHGACCVLDNVSSTLPVPIAGFLHVLVGWPPIWCNMEFWQVWRRCHLCWNGIQPNNNLINLVGELSTCLKCLKNDCKSNQ